MKNEDLIKKRRVLKTEIRELISLIDDLKRKKSKYSGEARDSQFNATIKKLDSALAEQKKKKQELIDVEAELRKEGLLGKTSEFKDGGNNNDDDF